MKAEFRELAKEVSHWQLTGDIKADLFLLPMEEELLSRHGDLIGRRLYWDFVDAFWIQTWTEIPLDFSQMERAVGPMMDLFERLQSDRALRRMIHGRDYSTFYSNN